MEERKMRIYGEGGDPRISAPTPLEHKLLVSAVRHIPGKDSSCDIYEDDPRLRASRAEKENKEIRRHEPIARNGGDNDVS